MAKVALMEPALVVTLVTVIPDGALTVAPDRFDPDNVTFVIVAPCVPLLGLIELSEGPPLTVNAMPLLVTPALVTVTLCAPVGAVLEMAKVAVMEPALVLTLLTVIPVGALIVAPDRFDPESVTLVIVAPCVPLVGLIELSDGPPLMVKVTPLLVTPPLVTVTLCAPVGAVLEMAKVAVMEPALVVTLLTVIPVGALIVAPDRFEPARVTLVIVAPWVPLLGVIEVSDGDEEPPFTIAIALTIAFRPLPFVN
jgi:hypothetical protein